MNAPLSCSHCGHDLSQAPSSGAAASQCPHCGAQQLVASQARPAPPPRPPGARPAPPTPQAQVPAQPPSNPFMADAPAASNPFLSPEPAAPVQAAPQAMAPQAAPAPLGQPAAPLGQPAAPLGQPAAPLGQSATPPGQSAPQPQLNVGALGTPQNAHASRTPSMAPSLRDAHADFRRGQWKKPVLGLVLAAAAVAAVVVLTPEGEAPKPVARGTQNLDNAVIGRSTSPDVLEDPDKERLKKLNERSTVEQETEPAGTTASTSGGGFSDAFKSAAR